MSEAVTLGEVFRGVTLLRQDLVTLSAQIGERPDWKDISRVEAGLQEKIKAGDEKSAAEAAAIREEVDKLSGWGTWATRLVGTGVIGAILSYVFTNTP